MPEENQTGAPAPRAEPLPASVDDIYHIVKQKLDELQIKTVVLIDNDLAGDLDVEHWAECIDAIREVDEKLLHMIEEIVNKYGTGNLEDYPTSIALPQIVGVIAASKCEPAKAMLSQPGSEKALETLEGYLRELNLEVKTYWKTEDVPKNEKLYFIDFRMQSDPETDGVDAAHLLSEIISNLGESGDPPGAVLMSRSQNERPAATDLEHIARDGGGFLRSNFRYLDKAEMLPSRKRFLFMMNDLLDSLPLGRDYFAQVRALRKAVLGTVKTVAEETCGLLPADFRLFAEAVGGTGAEQAERMGEHILALFTSLLVAELRSDKDTQASLDAFIQMLMKRPGMAPGEVASHTLHRIHSRLLYDQSDWIKRVATTFGDIFTCYRDKRTFYLVITPECDLEPQIENGVRVSPKANSVVLLRGDVRDERPLDQRRDDVIVTPLVVDPQTDKAGWVYWQLRAPLIVPRNRLAPGSRRFAKWGRLRVQEAEKIQMRYATDLLAVGADDLADRVEKRKATFWREERDKQIRVEQTFHILEIVNPKRHKEIYWALSEGCEHFLCPDEHSVVPASVALDLRRYQLKRDFVGRLRPYGVGVFEPATTTAIEERRDAEIEEGEADSALMTQQRIPTPDSGIDFVWFESKRIPKKWRGPTGRAQAPRDSNGVDLAPPPSATYAGLPTVQAAVSPTEKPLTNDAEEPNVGTERSEPRSELPTRQPAPSTFDKPDNDGAKE